MNNDNLHGARLEDGSHEWRRMFAVGAQDVRRGAGYRDEYERLGRNEQFGYEQGRLMAINMLVAGVPVPAWAGDRAGAPAFWNAYVESTGRVGHSLTVGK